MTVQPSIALVGLRGAGKTTVGERLAQRLGRVFLDSDREVEARLGRSIAQLFATGEIARFRAAETEFLCPALARPGLVIGTGGGCVEDERVREALSHCFTVWLTAPPAVLVDRIGATRPALTDLPPLAEMELLATRREPWYGSVARLRVATAERSPEEVCDVIEHAWRGVPAHDLR